MLNRIAARVVLSVAAAVVASGGGSAYAQMADSERSLFQGLYISGLLGAHQTSDADISGGSIAVEAETDADLAAMFGVGLELGKTPWRVELETGWRPSDVDSISNGSGSGSIDAVSFMGNVFYDVAVAKNFEIYIGGGLGLGNVDYDSVTPVSTTAIDDDDLGWAWQLGAGAAYALTDRIKLTLDYRFLNIEDLDFRSSPSVAELDADYEDHAVFVGLRFALFAPPKPPMEPKPVAAPAPAAPQRFAPQFTPAPEPTRNFIVFFDWDRADITAEADAILRDAAETARSIAPVRIIATGHADRSGPARYNQGLSARRAAAVKARVQQLGIAPSDIATFAKGETDPLVPTPDGVREPQNRRVEIVLQ